VRIMAISFTFQILAYTIFYLHTRTLGLGVPYLYCLAFVPIVSLLEALPISIAGLGVREGGLIFFLGKLDVPAADAIALSILILTARYGLNLLGGLLYLTRRQD